jgi:predicted ATPase
MGLGGGGAADGEASWAVRKLFETLADRRPLVVVLDDLQWAEPTFVALVDSVAELSRDSPILLLCIARPELLDGHPGWGGGKLNATTMLLEPLNDADCRTLISNTLGRGPLPVQVETRIAEMAGGNPLFAEELVAMLLEEELLAFENNGWVAADDLLELPVPQSINTLLAARLEGLPDDERSLLVRASVAGTLFHLGAIAELAPELPAASLERTLAALIRRDLIRPGRSSFAGDDAYRFRHLLIRDAAYRSLPKATRADLHERFAAWLERAAAGRSGEYEEIVGYHYEQAFQFRAELAPVDEEGRVLALAAGSRLAAAGRRAFARGDMPAATALLERAMSVSVGDAARRAELLPELGAALTESGRLAEAESALREAQQEASVLGDERLEAHVLILQLSLRLQVATDATAAAAAAVERVLPVFRRAGDQLGICRAHRLDAWVHWIHCQTHAAEAAWEKAAEHAHRAGAVREEADSLLWLASSALFGPCPAREGVARCHEVLSKMPGGVIAQTLLLFPLAALRAMLGELDEAQRMLAEANATLADVGVTLSANSHPEAFVAMLADDPAAAERCLRADYDSLADMGEKGFLSTTAALLARAVEAQRRDEEAYELTEVAERNGASDDLATQIVWRGVRARILAERGSAEEAEQLARDAVALAEQTDRLNYHGDALDDLASVLERSGRTEEELRALEAALAVFERKENLVASARIRVRLGEGKPA